jgi:hypothetical protein
MQNDEPRKHSYLEFGIYIYIHTYIFILKYGGPGGDLKVSVDDFTPEQHSQMWNDLFSDDPAGDTVVKSEAGPGDVVKSEAIVPRSRRGGNHRVKRDVGDNGASGSGGGSSRGDGSDNSPRLLRVLPHLLTGFVLRLEEQQGALAWPPGCCGTLVLGVSDRVPHRVQCRARDVAVVPELDGVGHQ